MTHGVARLLAATLAALGLALLPGAPASGDTPKTPTDVIPADNGDIQSVKEAADRQAAAVAECGRMKCPVCDCAAGARLLQALVDAEAVMDAMHRALIDATESAMANYNNLVANSHLTGVMIAQAQTSLAWQELFHKLGGYLLKMESILNTLGKIDDGKAAIDGEKGVLDAIDKMDSLANLVKNVSDITTDFTMQVATGSVPSTPDLKAGINTAWDVKSEGVDIAKVARDARNALKESGVDRALAELKKSRNLRTAVARALKAYSDYKLKQEKLLLRELEATEGPEAAAVARAFRELQRANARKVAADDALDALRKARDAIAACMASARCGSRSTARPVLGPFTSYGGALRALNAWLAQMAAGLAAPLAVRDACPPDGTSPGQPPVTDGPVETPPTPRHVVENDCPECQALAEELARTLDERDFIVAELKRIREDGYKADEIEKDAELLRNTIKRITDLVRDFRDGRKDRNALLQAGNAIFRALMKPETEITIEGLERERTATLIKLRSLEERITALRAEQGSLSRLQDENLRLYERAEALKARLVQCQAKCGRHASIETVRPRTGNNPFDPQNPLGGFVSVTPVAPGTCTTSQPPAQTRTQSCPSGQTGSITETSTYACVGTTWTAGPFVTTSNTCTTPPPPVSGCATAFGSGNYSCSGSCGIGSVGLSVTPGSNSMTANPFGANSNVAFTCLNQNALSASNNLTILGASGHTCNLSGLGASSLGIQCRNNSGGSCSSSCSR